MDMRKKFKDEFQKKHGVKMGFMSAFLKASAHALCEMPVVNAGELSKYIQATNTLVIKSTDI